MERRILSRPPVKKRACYALAKFDPVLLKPSQEEGVLHPTDRLVHLSRGPAHHDRSMYVHVLALLRLAVAPRQLQALGAETPSPPPSLATAAPAPPVKRVHAIRPL